MAQQQARGTERTSPQGCQGPVEMEYRILQIGYRNRAREKASQKDQKREDLILVDTSGKQSRHLSLASSLERAEWPRLRTQGWNLGCLSASIGQGGRGSFCFVTSALILPFCIAGDAHSSSEVAQSISCSGITLECVEHSTGPGWTHTTKGDLTVRI